MPRNKESEEPSQSEDLTVRGVPEGQLRPRSPNGAFGLSPHSPLVGETIRTNLTVSDRLQNLSESREFAAGGQIQY